MTSAAIFLACLVALSVAGYTFTSSIPDHGDPDAPHADHAVASPYDTLKSRSDDDHVSFAEEFKSLYGDVDTYYGSPKSYDPDELPQYPNQKMHYNPPVYGFPKNTYAPTKSQYSILNPKYGDLELNFGDHKPHFDEVRLPPYYPVKTEVPLCYPKTIYETEYETKVEKVINSILALEKC